MNNSISYSSKAFHLWPFGLVGQHLNLRKFLWRGFVEKTQVTINDSEFIIQYRNEEWTYPIKDLEFCIKKNRWFRLGNPKIIIGSKECSGHKDSNEHWLWVDYCYINKADYDIFMNVLKSKEPKCFSPDSLMVETTAAWYRVDKLLTGNRDSLWLNKQHAISSVDAIRHNLCIDIDKIKYFYTKGLLSNSLYIGDNDIYISLQNVNNQNIKVVQEYILNNGGNIAADADMQYEDCWTPNVLFSPSLWFTHSWIGFTPEGIVYKQKTFKTNDNLFLPYEKVNLATYTSKWSWLFTKDISIYGEQNILPKKRFSKEDVAAIQQKLEEKGIYELEGESFSPSYHTSWFGILLSIITGSIYHWIVVAFYIVSKRNKMVIGSEKAAWTGRVYGFTADKEDHWDRKEMKNLTSLVLEGKDVRSVVFLKKRWYHLWGYIYIWARPYNIRWDNETYQSSVDYDLEMGKIWSWKATNIRKKLENAGYEKNNDRDKFYKKWAKHFLMNS